MNKQDQLKQIAEIKSLMERSSRCLSLSGLSGVAAGVVAIISGVYIWWYLGDYSFLSPITVSNHFLGLSITHPQFLHVVFIASLTLLMALGLAFYFTMENSRKKGVKLWDASTRYFLWNLFIPLITGGIFIIALTVHGILFLIASSTLVFYGLALLNASRYTHREIRYLGLSEVVLGLLSMFYVGYGLLFWMIGFGVLHIGYGILMYRNHERA